MATYEYECPVDGKITTITRLMSDPEGRYYCPNCEVPLLRVYTAPPIKFNGTGFYSTGG